MGNANLLSPQGGRPETRLYCLPDGRRMTYNALREEFNETEVATIVKRCQRLAKGHSIRYIQPPTPRTQ